MTVVLYMDEHIHSSISVGLRLQDVDVLTVQADERSPLPGLGFTVVE
jgi:hypothetical protein